MKKSKLLICIVLFISILGGTLYSQVSNRKNYNLIKISEIIGEDAKGKVDYLLIPLLINMHNFENSEKSLKDRANLKSKLKNYSNILAIDFNHDSLKVEVLIKSKKNNNLRNYNDLEIHGVHKGKDSEYITATIPIDKIEEMASEPDVIYIEAAKILHSLLNTSTDLINADDVWQGNVNYSINDSINGDSVYVGVIELDTLKWDHETFISPEGEYRIKAMWLEGDTLDHWSNFPQYTGNDFHPTHVTGIAAGDGDSANKNYKGVAYKSDILFAKIGSFNHDPNTNSALDGYEWMIYKASNDNKSLVVNMSLGAPLGPHDGSTLFEEALNTKIDTSNTIFVVAAGNSGRETSPYPHIDGYVPDIPGDSLVIEFRINYNNIKSDNNSLTFEIWGEGEFDVRVSDNDWLNPEWTDLVEFGYCIMDTVLESDTISIYNNDTSIPNNSNDHVIQIVIKVGSHGILLSGNYKISLHPHNQDTGGNIDGYHSEPYCTKGGFLNGDSFQSILIPASAEKVITVANHINEINGDIYHESSLGPLRTDDEYTVSKPDIAAPGSPITSSIATGIMDYGSGSGTSMAAPHVTGAIALLLQKFPDLNADQIKQILQNSTGGIPNGTWPLTLEDNKYWGAGKLDILEAYKSMVGFEYTQSYPYVEDKFKDTFEEHEDIAGLPIEPVEIGWNGVDYFKQKLTNGALFLDQSGINEAFWIGENIWNNWMCPSSIGLPISSQYLDFQNNLYQTVDFENGRIYYDGNNAHTVYLRADFHAANRFGSTPFDVTFVDLSVGNIISWEWDFDSDGIVDSYEQNPSYTYNLPGVYSVTLKINDGNDNDWEIKSHYIEVYGLGNFTEVRLSNDNSNSEWPAIDFDNFNNASIVWQDYRDGNWEIYFCRIDENNNIIVTPTNITQTSSNSTKPDIGVDDAGNSYIVWEESGDIKYCKVDTAGIKVVNDITLDSGDLPAISSLDDGTSGIAWEKPGILYKTKFEKRDSAGNIIGDAIELNSLCYFVQKNCYIDHDNQDNFYVWRLELGNWFSHYYHIAKITSSNSIAYNGAFLQASDDSKECCLGITQEDNAYLFYIDYTDGYYQIYDGSQNPQSSGDGDSRYPNMATKPQNRSYFTLVWEDDRNGNWEVYFNKYDDNNFIAEQILNNDNEHSRHPDVACNTNGKWSIVWEDYKDGNSEIYYMKLDYVPPTNLEAPDNVIIFTNQDSVYIDWEPVQGATFYKVYSTNNLNSGFTIDNSGIFDGSSWKAPLNNTQKFYYVTSDNCRKNISPKSRKLNEIINESYLWIIKNN